MIIQNGRGRSCLLLYQPVWQAKMLSRSMKQRIEVLYVLHMSIMAPSESIRKTP